MNELSPRTFEEVLADLITLLAKKNVVTPAEVHQLAIPTPDSANPGSQDEPRVW